MLAVEREGAGPRLVLVHGFTQTGRSWPVVVDDLARDHEVVRVDAPGHGGSVGAPAGLVEGAAVLADAAGEGTWVGYSMGGRYCLHVALTRPEVVRGLVLLGATGGLDDPGERAARRRADEALADRLEADGLDAFLDGWVAQPLFARLTEPGLGMAERRRNPVAGLAASLRSAGTGTQEPLWDRLRAIDVPVLVLAGALDERFAALGRRLAASVGANATFAEVPDAGHAAHLERPAAFLSILRPWLATHGL